MGQDAGQPKPNGYFPGETDFKQLCEQNDLDLVVTCRGSNEFDGFTWEPIIWQTHDNEKGGIVGIRAAQILENASKI